MQFSCQKFETSSCPSTPSPTSTTSASSRVNQETLYALVAENADLRAEVDALREHIENLERQGTKQWIQENLEEAQQLIDNIVGIKGITENPLKAAAKLEGLSILTSHTNTTNSVYCGDKNVISATTSGTLEKQFVIPPHDELYGY
jgi:hypothetical protein